MGTGRAGLLAEDEEEGLFALLWEGLLCALDELPWEGRLAGFEEDEGLLVSPDEGLLSAGLDEAGLDEAGLA